MSPAPHFTLYWLTQPPRPRVASAPRAGSRWPACSPRRAAARWGHARGVGRVAATSLLLAALLLPLAANAAQAASLFFLLQQVRAAGQPLAAPAPVPPADAPAGGSLTARLGHTVFFAATDAAHGRELWKSDGTLSGTRLVSDINPGPGHSDPSDLVTFDGRLFFVADDGRHGAELWQSDGTPGGTALVADLNRTAADANTRTGATVGAGVSNLTVAGGQLFFTANDGTHGQELWVYDGATLRLVKDINRGAGGSSPTALINVNGTLFFTANDGTHGFQLWLSDGTPRNTSMVQVVNPARAACPDCQAPPGLRLNFSINSGARGPAGRPAGTPAAAPIKDLTPAAGFNALWLTAAGNTLFFRADSGTRGRVLWRPAGFSGPLPVTDTPPGSDSSSSSLISLTQQSNISGTCRARPPWAGRPALVNARAWSPRAASAYLAGTI